jgi:hypothetical protein
MKPPLNFGQKAAFLQCSTKHPRESAGVLARKMKVFSGRRIGYFRGSFLIPMVFFRSPPRISISSWYSRKSNRNTLQQSVLRAAGNVSTVWSQSLAARKGSSGTSPNSVYSAHLGLSVPDPCPLESRRLQRSWKSPKTEIGVNKRKAKQALSGLTLALDHTAKISRCGAIECQ